MLRAKDYMDPIPGEMDFDPSIEGIHYLHGSLEYLDPFGLESGWGPRGAEWVFDDGSPIRTIEHEYHDEKGNRVVRRREEFGCRHLPCEQLAGSGFNTSGRPYEGIPGERQAMNYDEHFALPGDDLVIMPTCPNEVARMQFRNGVYSLPPYWGLKLNEYMDLSKFMLLRTPASRITTGAPELYMLWSGNPAVRLSSESDMEGVLSEGHAAPTVRQCRDAASRWRYKYQREWIHPEFNHADV